jgi:hypothetical protein
LIVRILLRLIRENCFEKKHSFCICDSPFGASPCLWFEKTEKGLGKIEACPIRLNRVKLYQILNYKSN